MKLIAGKINGCDKIYYWSWEFDHEPKCDNYVIVESLKDYSLAKIIGVVETDYPRQFANNHKVKRCVLSVPKGLLDLSKNETIEPAKRFLNETDVRIVQYNQLEDFFKER